MFHRFRPITASEFVQIGTDLRRRKSRTWEADLGGLIGVTTGRISQLKKNPTTMKHYLAAMIRVLQYGRTCDCFDQILATSQVCHGDWMGGKAVRAWPNVTREHRLWNVPGMSREELYHIGARLSGGRRDHAWHAVWRYSGITEQWGRRLRDETENVPPTLAWWLRFLAACYVADDFTHWMARACGHNPAELDITTVNRYRYRVAKPRFNAEVALALFKENT